MKQKRLKKIAWTLLVVFSYETFYPLTALALTSGPSQPEVQSFEPFSTSEMVSMSSGDFTYNIPLIDLDGYPVNLSYSSGIGMDQEAGWVGLGWNINPGVINRNMRGIPDDFNGDVVTKETNIKANNTYGVNFPVSGELLGIELANIGLSLGISFNNYKGVGLDASFSIPLSSAANSKGSMNASLGVSLGSESGLGISPQLSFSKTIETEEDKAIGINGKIGMPFNSRSGLSALTLSGSAGPMALKKNNADMSKDNPETAEAKKEEVSMDNDGNKGEAKAAGPQYTPSGPAFSGGGSISLAGQTYTPSISMPMLNLSLSASFTGGFEIFGLHPNIRLNGYYSGQYLMGSSRSLPAYGYLHMQNGQVLNAVMLDFNREKDGGYSDNTPALPLTNFTYDIYAVSGQGIGGMYRAFRSDLGYVFDGEVNTYSMNIPLPGIELGAGAAAGRGGLNISLNFTQSGSGKWADDNVAASSLKFKHQGHNGDPLYEAVYFKQAGEKLSETDPDFFNKMGGFDARRIELLSAYSSIPSLNVYKNETKGTYETIHPENYRKKRARRNELITPLTGEAASALGLSKNIESYADPADQGDAAFNISPSINSVFGTGVPISRTSGPRKAHHISEITSLRSDGARYVYGIPAYNLYQKDVTFAVSGRDADVNNGLVSYIPGKDNTPNNNNGTDNYFERVNNPSYAHSYLLTAVLGANYMDLTGDGPTLDDLGSYTRFNYSRVSGDGFQWRTPFEENKATHNEGLKSQSLMDEYNDDKASYIYGKKEVWYMHSIESKNRVAIFYTSYRDDGLGVKDENGGKETTLGDSRLRKLDRIVLYSREDLVKNGLTGAVPIKTVHFEYNYSQCKNIPNHVSPSSSNGKLTLTKVYFTFGKSPKGKLSPYEFRYGELKLPGGSIVNVNPSYNMKGYDRWGNYKQTAGDASFSGCAAPNQPLNAEFPYTDQDKFSSGCSFNGLNKADVYAYAWNLTTIVLPSGGEIKVEYEADDYAYVQNRRAMQMMKVVGAYTLSEAQAGTFNPASSTRNTLYNLYNRRDWLVIDITDIEGSDGSAPDDETARRRYFSEYNGQPMANLYFKFLISLRHGKSEWVPGYLKYDYSSVAAFKTGSRKYLRVRITPATDNLVDYNRISYTAWNFMRLQVPRLAYNQPNRNMGGIMQTLKALQSMGESVLQTAAGFSNYMTVNGCASSFDTDKSFIRLYCGTNKKKGGGVRVKRITSHDKWATLTNDAQNYDFDYGQEYNYTMKNEYGETVSSGVAAYEPAIGGDENPFKQPVFYSEDKLLAPDDDFYQEEPYGESFFPSPGITYAKVTVSSLKRPSVTVHATGKVVHEFYTTRDFPTITTRTSLHPVRIKPNVVERLLNFIVEDYMTVSQGYVIELNDMNGKPKAQWVYGEKQKAGGITGEEQPISGVEYKYKQSGSKLDNYFNVVDNKGLVTAKMVGVEADQIVDFREQKTITRAGGFGGNLDAFLALILPVVIPVVLPSYSSEEVRFRSAVVTKVINRYALMEETISYTDGAKSSVKNMAIDEETGEVLLTESTNVFGDKMYSFTYPAHWIYDQMGPAYKNVGYYVNRNNGGTISPADPNLTDGDELLIQHNVGGVIKGWVGTQANGTRVFSSVDGSKINPADVISLYVVRSGRKNQPATPVGTVTTLSNPLIWGAGGVATLNLNDNILNTSATEYSDDWKIFCECELALAQGETKKYNKLLRKRGGAWRPKTAWAYITPRKQLLVNNNTNVRTDGIYENYNPFWVQVNGRWQKTSTLDRWQFKTSGTIYSPYGMELESVDPLNRYSAATYGYGNTLATSVGSNTKYREIGFDGFEDYQYSLCTDEHFSYRKPLQAAGGATKAVIVNTTSHSGYKSINVKPNQTLRLSKKLSTCN